MNSVATTVYGCKSGCEPDLEHSRKVIKHDGGRSLTSTLMNATRQQRQRGSHSRSCRDGRRKKATTRKPVEEKE
ncbi:hypothetical protein E2C01_031829 [Portunus trituberculatus]|uniref:Uncharacterized protein n=1 Tax=Portunus trituberculatus TaxID=210409 RepID=A0A5B7F147_PORTR|nr:hypothetical protein [Portunus trituberculatus]